MHPDISSASNAYYKTDQPKEKQCPFCTFRYRRVFEYTAENDIQNTSQRNPYGKDNPDTTQNKRILGIYRKCEPIKRRHEMIQYTYSPERKRTNNHDGNK